MSDSQSSEQIEIKTELKVEARLRDLLEKAKEITPFYDEDTLLLIYKDSFQNDTVFINKLNIIAKNHKEAEDVGDHGWIHFKSHSKEKAQQNRPGVKQQQERQKYNFLEDKALIERAMRFDPEREKEKWQRKQEEARERQENKFRNNQAPKQQFREKDEKKVESPTQEKKMKYKVKQQQQEQHIQKTLPQENPVPKQESPVKPKYQEKIVQKQIEKKETKQEKKPEKKEEIKEKEVAQEKPAAQTQDKKVVPETPAQSALKPQVQEPKKAKIQYKLKDDSKPTKEEPTTVSVASKEEVKVEAQISQAGSQQKILSPTKKAELDPKVATEFDLSCSQNTFILKFIPPSAKLQKVSYIREPKGSYRDVKVREVLPRN